MPYNNVYPYLIKY